MQWHQYTKTQLAQELKTNLETGLENAEAQRRLVAVGPNLLPEKPPASWVSIFFRQFRSPLIYVLIAAAVAVFFMKEIADSLIIFAVLVFNAAVGAVQEGKNQQTLESLKKLTQTEGEVIRGGTEMVVLEKDVVPGDVLVLQEGQKITADARIIFSSNLSVDESALTGESGAVHKHDGSLSEDRLPLASRHNMVFKGTSVLSGNGRAVVVATGIGTEIGKISKILLQPDTEIPLQKKIRRFSRVLIYAIGVISTALFFLGLSYGRGVKEMFAIVVSLAVSIIPEGLPLVLTMILVTGVWRMSKRNALVKKLQAVEALGQASVIAVDKTGTLTRNEMLVKKLYVAGKIYGVSGNGYQPHGRLLFGQTPQSLTEDLNLMAVIAALVSRASVRFLQDEKVFKVAGDPTEAAMLVLAEKLGQSKDSLAKDYKELAETPFDYRIKYRAIFYEHKGEVFCAIAGAPEVLFKSASHFLENGQSRLLEPVIKKAYEAAFEEFSSEGFRVVAFGYKRLNKTHALDDIQDLVLGGLFAIEDSMRPEAPLAIKKAQRAGIKVVMITGDHKITAKAIAKEAGIFQEGDLIITGNELAELSPVQLAEKLHKISVFARVTPEDKSKIIQGYRHAGLIVAMTGDGVNDAASLVAADLGVAMGKIGTEVAKEAADIVLLDDNLESIVAAVEEGRNMYQNIQKAILFLFSTSLGELLTIVLALLLHMPMPLLAVQILWLNLITDPSIGIALALEKKEPGLLFQGLKKQPANFLSQEMLVQMALIGAVMATGTLYLFKLYYPFDYYKAATMALTVLAVFQWYNGINCRFPKSSVFSSRFFANPYLFGAIGLNFCLQLLALYSPWMQKVLRTAPLNVYEWLIVFAFGLAVILAEEARKLAVKLFREFFARKPKAV
jgi:Ca2+-transporting ATPase